MGSVPGDRDPSPVDLPARGPHEIRALQRTFNRLVTALQGYRERITHPERANIGRFLAPVSQLPDLHPSRCR